MGVLGWGFGGLVMTALCRGRAYSGITYSLGARMDWL
jgi:hypothetical protein